MLIIGVLLNIVGLGIFCWALFALATHALPFFVGMTVGIYSFQAGAGPFGAIVVGFIMAGFTLVVGQYAFSVARSPDCPPCHWAAICASCGTRRLRCDLRPCSCRCSRGMVAGGVRHFRRHHRREHRLGARVDPDRARSETGVLPRPYSATDWGSDQGQVTLWVRRLSVGISADIRFVNMTATSRSSRTLRLSRAISSADCNPVVAGACVGFCLLGDKGRAFLHARVSLCFAWNAGLLVWADR